MNVYGPRTAPVLLLQPAELCMYLHKKRIKDGAADFSCGCGQNGRCKKFLLP